MSEPTSAGCRCGGIGKCPVHADRVDFGERVLIVDEDES